MWRIPDSIRLRTAPAIGFGGAALLLFLGVAGLVALERYERTPGVVAPPPAVWPADTSLVWRPGKVNVVVAVHPRCVCTQATFANLLDGRQWPAETVHFHMLFLQPSEFVESWHEGRLWTQAENPGASRLVDRDGWLARRFGALTSGAVAAYRPDGSLGFSGGVTPARGIAGAGDGLRSLRDVVAEASSRQGAGGVPVEAVPSCAPVFGCSICRSRSSGI